MIRHVSIFTLRPGGDRAAVVAAFDLLRDTVPGPLGAAYGTDAGLRAGNGDIGVTFDFEDEDAYRAWDTHPEHDRIRKELIGSHVAGVVRVQFRI